MHKASRDVVVNGTMDLTYHLPLHSYPLMLKKSQHVICHPVLLKSAMCKACLHLLWNVMQDKFAAFSRDLLKCYFCMLALALVIVAL